MELGMTGNTVIVCTLSLAAWMQFVSGGYNDSFHWLPSAWSACAHKEMGSCCDCYRIRNVSCVYTATEQEVPSFYCHKSGKPRLQDKQPCVPCHQDCVLTPWSEWSQCSDTCTPGTRFRKRDVILPPQYGGAICGPLVELKECDNPNLPLCILSDISPQYQWRIGGWSSCRKLTNDSACGDGIRDRAIECETLSGRLVAKEYCLYYLHALEPIGKDFCRVPCDCDVTSWSDWGPCSKSCYKGSPRTGYHGYQVRTRSVSREPEDGGATCPAVKDTKHCDISTISRCPRYSWHHSDWSECRTVVEAGTADCGPGVQTRDVDCTLEGDTSHQPVSDVLCVQELVTWDNNSSPFKPPERRACQVACPKDCSLGEWENWSSCTQSCGTGGVRIRTRPVVQERTEGGAACNTTGRYEEKLCDPISCHWWHTGQWSACTSESIYGDNCGPSSQVRSVYCLNSLDEVLSDDICEVVSPKPVTRQDCWIPCEGDCQASDWSAWGPCSATCGTMGGTQSRSRTILRSKPDLPCPLADDLEQTRVCNQFPCKVYLWQVGPWEECTRRENATELCGQGTGIQYRELTCQMDPGYPVNASHCDPNKIPVTSQICAAPCPQDCKLSGWGDWSICTQSCGYDSLKVKTRLVMRWPMYNGKPCSGSPDENGIVMKKKQCTRRSLQCAAVQWKATEWGHCQVRDLGQGSCGKGTQTRNVTCVKDGSKEVNTGICFEDGLGAPPVSSQSCHIQCPGDCRLSQWSEFTPCSQTCGSTPGMRMRTRFIINWDPSRTVEAQCPQLKHVALVDNLPCNMIPCPTYRWVTSDWGSCIPNTEEETTLPSCGQGLQTRHVLCVQDNGVYVPEHRCDIIAAMPRRHQTCHVPCHQDCVVSTWSDWSNCSHPCGNGLKHRERRVVRKMSHGGRKCPPLQEVTTCFERDCTEFDWQVSDWDDCIPHWNMHCGKGSQSRAVTCPAGVQYDTECSQRAPRPVEQTECFLPCLGDCVMSEWSDFTHCDCQTDKSRRTRTRQILQEGLSSAVQCGPTTEIEPCVCPTYQLVIGGWTNCQVFKSSNQNGLCGDGIQKRSVNCIHGDGIIVHLSNCLLGNLTLSQSCEVACPEDCEVSEYTPWSPCSDQCGVRATRSRSVSVLSPGNMLGRTCPRLDQLKQTQVCNSAPCYNYTWHRGLWHGCSSTLSGSCGVSRETRVVQCRRSDGAMVQEVYCLLQEKVTVTSLDDLAQSDALDLDLDRERSCGTPCPGDCVVTEWSDYGPCIQNCSHGHVDGVQTRSRAIIRPALGGSPCPWDLIQTRPCPTEDSLCPVFTWEAGPWNERNKRKVQCLLNGGLVVNGGCVQETQPFKHKDCSDTCGEFAECIEGRCTCELGFLGDGFQCLPEFGCATDIHCFLNDTYCDSMNKECLCWDGALPGSDLSCVIHADRASREQDSLEDLNQLFVYILIGCLIALLLLGMVTVICIVSHSRRRKKRSSSATENNKLTKIDNLDTMPKNNDKKPETIFINKDLDGIRQDKNLARSWQKDDPNHKYHPNLTLSSSDYDTGKGDSTSSGSPPSFSSQMERKLENIDHDLDVDLFSDVTDDELACQPLMPLTESPRRPGSNPRQGDPDRLHFDTNSLPSASVSPLHPDTVLRVPSSRSVQPPTGSDEGSCLSSFRPDDSATQSTDSGLTAIWIPQNDLSSPETRENRFPVEPISSQNVGKSDSESENDPAHNRNLTSTPPDMYENLTSPESSPELQRPPLPPPRIARGPPPPLAPKPSPEHVKEAKNSLPVSRPVNRRHNTEPVPAQFRNGVVFSRGDAVAPAEAGLAPPRNLTESNSAKDLKDLQGRPGGQTAAHTQDLLEYCDQLLADLQRVANS